jgi:BirA family transcriptional regulator, biotin operon repressor / biotin---[acetyl-CoA-carboxylase] ligase
MELPAKKFIILKSVDSTNNYAMALVQNELAAGGEAIFAMEQTSGKGRRGKAWLSKKGDNIILSIIAQMQWLSVQQQFQLSAAVAVGCHEFFSKYSKESIKIKWPNDIYINDRKAGGVLIENIIHGSLWQWAVVGIGLNINQLSFEHAIENPISLKQITGETYDVIQLSRELHEIILEKIHSIQPGNFSCLLAAYNESLFCLHKKVKLKKGNIVFETEIVGVSESGELITKDTMERRFGFDDVTWIINNKT